MRKERLYKLTSYLEGRISYKEKMVRDFEIVMNRHGKCIAKKKKAEKLQGEKINGNIGCVADVHNDDEGVVAIHVDT